jgi:hypothetical protein
MLVNFVLIYPFHFNFPFYLFSLFPHFSIFSSPFSSLSPNNISQYSPILRRGVFSNIFNSPPLSIHFYPFHFHFILIFFTFHPFFHIFQSTLPPNRYSPFPPRAASFPYLCTGATLTPPIEDRKVTRQVRRYCADRSTRPTWSTRMIVSQTGGPPTDCRLPPPPVRAAPAKERRTSVSPSLVVQTAVNPAVSVTA